MIANDLIIAHLSVGRIKVKTEVLPFDQNHPVFKNVQLGGHYEPVECQSRNKVAIVVPLRNRFQHLNVLLRHLHPFLQRQQLAYAIFVIEQSADDGYDVFIDFKVLKFNLI